MLEVWATPWKRAQACSLPTFVLVPAVAAAVVGISDNPPGAMPASGAATALVLAFVHAWRMVCPPALLVGVAGTVVLALRGRSG